MLFSSNDLRGQMDAIENLKQLIVKELAQKEGRPVPAPGECPLCGAKPPFQFKDELSKKDFAISGLCQKCQDQAYSGE